MRAVKHRNMLAQVGLFIITLGIYGFYWFYVTADEMKGITNDETANPTLWTVLLFIPFLDVYALYRYSSLFQDASSESLNRWILFILWLVFAPAVWFIVQTDLNKKAIIPAAQPA